jgi:hypothetical protein
VVVAGQAATVIGVASKGFRGLSLADAPDLYLPLDNAGAVMNPNSNIFASPTHRSSPTSWITIVGRLGPRTSTFEAVARLNGFQAAAGRDGSRTQYGLVHVDAAALPAAARGAVRQFTRLLVATVALLVLVGCASVAMLLLIRTDARRHEFATCMALGASRTRLASGVAIEGALLASAGAMLAVPATAWLLAGLRTFQLPGGVNLELLSFRSTAGRRPATARRRSRQRWSSPSSPEQSGSRGP